MMEDGNPVFTAIRASLLRPSWLFLFFIFTGIVIFTLQITSNTTFRFGPISGREGLTAPDRRESCSGLFQPPPQRAMVKSIAEFGGVGDGKTSNTVAFQRAVAYLSKFVGRGGAQLNVPKGRWLTGSFNVTSDFTLFLEDGAVVLGSQDPEEWPIIEPLPSYGRGRERPGGRHISLIHGNSLTNVVITGENGTVNGQGKMWWDLWWNRTLKHTRGHLVELINSQNILISNLTFINSPFWTIHPVYCSNFVIKDMTILAPKNAPNTDGIDPGTMTLEITYPGYGSIYSFLCSSDSSTNVCIEDCYIESGDDLVAVKSGWDQYGINMAQPSTNITLRRVSGTTPTCSGIGIGSEMSGGISNILVEDLHVRDSAAGIRIKTDTGRGGYITNITIRNIVMERVKVPIRFSRGANDHPDEKWDRKALPQLRGLLISNLVSRDSRRAPLLEGIEGAPFEDICLKNVSINGLSPSVGWNCEFVSGFSEDVFPVPCPELQIGPSSSCSHS